MKKHIPTIVSLVSCLMTLLCLFHISALENRLYSLQNNFTNMQSILRDDIRNISVSVKNSVEEGNNLLSTSSYTLENPNLSEGIVDLNCVVTLKEFEPEGTSAVITCNEQTYPMELKNGNFVAKFPLSIFDTSYVTQVSFTRNGVVRTQALDWYIAPRDQFVPRMDARFSGTSTGTVSGANTYNIRKSGTLSVTVEQKGGLDYDVDQLDLIRYINGQEVERTDLLKQAPREDTAYFGKVPGASIVSKDPFELILDLDSNYSFPFASSMVLMVEMRDGSGYVHRSIVDVATISEDGKMVDDGIPLWHGAEGNIYDNEGTLLSGIDWNEEGYNLNLQFN